MKLTELNPRWLALEDGGPRVGLSFHCPHCPGTGQRLAVLFHHSGREAIEDGYILAHHPGPEPIWTESGDGFETMTLSPSVDASGSGHWHGFITNGEVT
ncbi:MAG: hypothetical protein JWQ72_2362 [Polaromonas sp.]|nr:hypothetical protein [Polaromonas sp.]